MSAAAGATHPMAPAHLPAFVAGPDGSDPFLTAAGLTLFAGVLGFGVFFFWLHTLPERLAHRSHKLQFEIVAVLGLIALFTHVHAFWVAGLLLALIDLPDVSTPIGRMAGALERIAGMPPRDEPSAAPDEPPAPPAKVSPLRPPQAAEG